MLSTRSLSYLWNWKFYIVFYWLLMSVFHTINYWDAPKFWGSGFNLSSLAWVFSGWQISQHFCLNPHAHSPPVQGFLVRISSFCPPKTCILRWFKTFSGQICRVTVSFNGCSLCVLRLNGDKSRVCTPSHPKWDGRDSSSLMTQMRTGVSENEWMDDNTSVSVRKWWLWHILTWIQIQGAEFRHWT